MTVYEMNYRRADITAFFNENVKKTLLRSYIAAYSCAGVMIFLIFLLVGIFMNGTFSLKRPTPYIVLGVFIIISTLAVLRMMKTNSDRMYREFMQTYDKNTIICTFGEDRVTINSTDETNSGNGHILYAMLEKVIETDNYFYLFIDNQSAQIVRKSALTEGSVEETEKLLRNGVGEKYIDKRLARRN